MNLKTGVGALAVALSTMGAHAQTTLTRTSSKTKSKSVIETITHTVSIDNGKKALKLDSLKADSIKADTVKAMVLKPDTVVVHDTVFVNKDSLANANKQVAPKARRKPVAKKPDAVPTKPAQDTVRTVATEVPVSASHGKKGCKCCDAHIQQHVNQYHTPAPAKKSCLDTVIDFFSNLF